MSTPVIALTSSGTLLTICSTSSVSLAAPTSPPPVETIVIFFACDSGAATSAAICVRTGEMICIGRCFFLEQNAGMNYHLRQRVQQHVDHCRLAVLAIGLGLLGQLLGLGLGLGRNGERLCLTANPDL